MLKPFKSLRRLWTRLEEKHLLPVLIVVYVGLITASAVWTKKQPDAYISPTPPVYQDVSAAQLLQQSLKDAASSTPAPMVTSTPAAWHLPLDRIEILLPFQADEFSRSNTTMLWRIHDSVDLKANRGDHVKAIADGVVLECGDDELLSTWILIDHKNGFTALYAGLALLNDYQPGDQVRAGAVIGFVGSGVFDTKEYGPHLRLRVCKEGTAIDPMSLLQ